MLRLKGFRKNTRRRDTHGNPIAQGFYQDDDRAACRCLNWREAQSTTLMEEPTGATLVTDQVDGTRLKDLEAALSEPGGLFGRHPGGELEMHMVKGTGWVEMAP